MGLKGVIKTIDEAIALNTESTKVTFTGKGYLRHILLSMDGADDTSGKRSEFRIYIDSEGTASTKSEPYVLWLGRAMTAAFSTQDREVIKYDEGAFAFMFVARVRIPFNTKLEISLFNKSVAQANIWTGAFEVVYE